MNKWATTSLVLLIAILCGTIHGAVLREQQQPLNAAHQQAPDHSNGTEKTDIDNAKPEKPEPNPKTSEPEKSKLYPAESESEASGEQARKKRGDDDNKGGAGGNKGGAGGNNKGGAGGDNKGGAGGDNKGGAGGDNKGGAGGDNKGGAGGDNKGGAGGDNKGGAGGDNKGGAGGDNKGGAGGDNKGGAGGDNKGGDNKGGDNKGGDNKGGDNKDGDNKGGDNKGGDNKGGDNKGGGNGDDNKGGGNGDDNGGGGGNGNGDDNGGGGGYGGGGDNNGTDAKNTSGPVNIGATIGPTSPSNTTDDQPPVNFNKTAEKYEPRDNIERKYFGRVYWDDVNKTCHSKVDKDMAELLPKVEVIDQEALKGATAKVKELHPGNNELFNAWSYCAKIMFYGEEGVAKAGEKFLGKKESLPKEEFANMAKLDKDAFMRDMVLLLIDGRIGCKGATEGMEVVTLFIVQDLKAGKIPEVCGAESRTYGNTTVTLVNGTANFVFGVVLNERLCPHNKVPGKVPDNIDDLVIEKLKYIYENLKLVVEHKCMGEQTINIMLPTIDVNINEQMKHAYQLRDLDLDLITLTDGVMLEKGDEMKDLNSGLYFPASIGSGTDKNTTSEPPKPPATAEADPKEKKHEIYDVEIVALEPDV